MWKSCFVICIYIVDSKKNILLVTLCLNRKISFFGWDVEAHQLGFLNNIALILLFDNFISNKENNKSI